MSRSRFSALLLSLSLVLPIGASAMATLFPDVPDSTLYKKEIEALVKAGAIHGNPDGTFHPNDNVSRAAILKMSYLAAKRKPQVSKTKCFEDSERYSWYEDFVCDAATQGLVQGVGNGLFAPDRPVTRTEGLKMIMEVFNMRPGSVTDADRALVKYADTVLTAWYGNYLVDAHKKGILPIQGQISAKFMPDAPLKRGEAAAYIYNAMNAFEKGVTEEIIEETTASSSSAAPSTTTSSSASSVASTGTGGPVSKNVQFPFKDTGNFVKKNSVSYLFDVKANTVVSVRAEITGAITSGMICRLYLIDEKTGFSDEYYLGVQSGTTCEVKAAVPPGKYQLQIQPTSGDAYFAVSAQSTTGDGNDGFREATVLQSGKTRTDVLSANDIADWYKLTVNGNSPLQAMFEVTSATKLSCIIYSSKDVDQFGFTGPECNKPYAFQPGTYYVGVGRSSGSAASQLTYTVKWK